MDRCEPPRGVWPVSTMSRVSVTNFPWRKDSSVADPVRYSPARTVVWGDVLSGNFYHHWMPDDLVESNRPLVREFVELALGLSGLR